MRVWIAVLAFTFLGMAGPRPEIPGDSSGSAAEAEAKPYHDSFKSLAATYGAIVTRSVSFAFGSFFGGTIGMCSYSGSRGKVTLSSSAWSRGSNTFKEMLVFHELGHCLLGRGHKNSTHSDGRPESLMRSSLFSEKTYNANRDGYLKELFTVGVRRAIAKLQGAKEEDYGDCTFGH